MNRVKVDVRRANADDVGMLADYALALGRMHVDFDERRFQVPPNGRAAFAAFFHGELGREDVVLLIAEAASRAVGYAFVRMEGESLEDLRGAGAWLHDIYVDPMARRLGVGRRLVEAAIEAARSLGSDSLMLGVSPYNAVARRLFEQSGLRPTMIEMRVELDR